jgi:hypothetical protein
MARPRWDETALLTTCTSFQAKAPPDARILKIRDYEDKLVAINSSVKVRQHAAGWHTEHCLSVREWKD